MSARPPLSYEVSTVSSAPPDAVFALLEDAPGWSRWAGPLVRWSAWEKDRGSGSPGGIGWVRLLGTRRFHSKEEIVGHERPRFLAYEVRAGFPVRGYRAEVNLEPEGAGTRIHWSGGFRPLVPLTGRLMLAFIRGMIGSMAGRLAQAAATPPAVPGGDTARTRT